MKPTSTNNEKPLLLIARAESLVFKASLHRSYPRADLPSLALAKPKASSATEEKFH